MKHIIDESITITLTSDEIHTIKAALIKASIFWGKRVTDERLHLTESNKEACRDLRDRNSDLWDKFYMLGKEVI